MRKNTASPGGLVYSTEHGSMCPNCRKPVSACLCRQNAEAAARMNVGGTAQVACETKGRGGKSVTVVKGLPLDAPGLLRVGKQLRSACGAGGTTKDGTIEVQGDHRDTVMATLKALGYSCRRTGS
jgi:translation initiation factor 1